MQQIHDGRSLAGMKKQLLIAFLLLPFAGITQIRLFAEGGITSSDLRPDSKVISNSGTESRTAGYGLAGVRISIAKKFCFENAVGIISRKYYYHFFVGPDYSGHVDYAVQSLYLHSIIDHKFSLAHKLSLNPGVGLYGAINSSGTSEATYSTIAGVQHENKDLKFGESETDDMKKIEFGALFRLRLQYRSFHIQAGYHLGLNDMTSGSIKETWKTWLIGAGISLHTKK